MADQISNLIQENPNLFIIVFAAIVVVIIVIRIIAAIMGRKKKKTMLESKDTVEVLFDEPLIDANQSITNAGISGHKIYSVNNGRPTIIGSSLMMPVGQSVIDLQYIISGKSFGSSHTNSFPRVNHTVNLESGKRYYMTYDIMEKVYECKEKN